MIKLRTKLLMSYVVVVAITIVLFSIVLDYFIGLHLDALYEGLRAREIGLIERLGNPEREAFIRAVRQSLRWTAAGAGLLAILLSLWISDYIVSPLKRLIAATEKIAKGDYKQRVEIRSADELGHLSESLNVMAACLEENARLRQELISDVSHELATPLTNISGYLDAMQDGLIKGKQPVEKTLSILKDETARLSTLVDDVRALSGMERPDFVLKRESFDLKEAVEDVLLKLKPQFVSKKIQYVSKVKKVQKVSLDKRRFVQVLMNLLTNAIHHTPKKGSVEVEAEVKKRQLILKVTDTGLGIPKKDLARVFERLYRGDKSRSRHTGGSGIGLSIVRQIVEAHGGDVSVDSKEGEGACFVCEFKL